MAASWVTTQGKGGFMIRSTGRPPTLFKGKYTS